MVFRRVRVQTMFKTMLEKIKNIPNKNMSFLKFTDPKKRDFIVNDSKDKAEHPTKHRNV